MRLKREKRLFTTHGKWLLAAALSLVLVGMLSQLGEVYAASAGSIRILEINYKNSTITLQANPADSLILFSDKNKKTWEAVSGELDENGVIEMDISWISQSSAYVLNFKGDVSTDVTSVTIPKYVSNFKATYNKVKGILTFTNQGGRTVEWRKKDSSVWNVLNESTIAAQLEMLCTQGATIYCRLAPENGGLINGVLEAGKRPSKEVSVTIPKKTAAPSIKVDGSAFLISCAANTAYRTVDEDGGTSAWTTVTSAKKLPLSTLASAALYSGAGTEQTEVLLQFRNNATSSRQVSHITTVTVPVQAGPPDEDANGIALTYTSAESLAIEVKSASATNAFEYTIVKAGETLNYSEASWTAITSAEAVTVKESKAAAGSHIYVRKKESGSSGSSEYAMASKEIDITGGAGVVYPEAAEATGLTTLITTAGVCNTDNTSSALSFTLYSPTKTTVSSISFADSFGTEKGTVSVKSTVTANTARTGSGDAYIITTKIIGTDALNGVTETMLYGTISLANGEKIKSDTTSGVRLYIYPASKVDNSEKRDYTAAFQRILDSVETSDDSAFTFRLVFGKANVPDGIGVDSFTGTPTAVAALSYDGYTLTEGQEFTVTYGTDRDDEGNSFRYADVTVLVAQVEKSKAVTTRDTATPLVITLNNQEVLEKAVTITLVTTARLVESPIAWSISAGSLQETSTSTVTNADGSTSSVTGEVISFQLALEIFSTTYDVGIADVTWGGESVLGSANVFAGEALVYLSNKKINQLTTTSTTTNNLVISMSNGFEIKTGCKLTIVKSFE